MLDQKVVMMEEMVETLVFLKVMVVRVVIRIILVEAAAGLQELMFMIL
tara:strand:- start:278 stop:421 length:144 start_codon:yes stop_codon:yes gene_type:complete